ncbi:glycosyltransferase family 2 protein [Falsihalocynthiibacter sp. S25ZX9]|uniref:glycosyltransferase family 2 protein n=1 Tax=Falsihalocynthiibacter sp. S25ZX9 TaxID=3240870 RepID=UPI003510661A
MPDISVIIPAYRPLDFEALKRSMAANSNAHAEWIVVDDGSGPEYDAVFATLDGSPARVIRREQNCRQGAARNVGLLEAKGAWIKFLDADDQLDEGHLAALLKEAENLPEKAIPFAPTKHVFTNGNTSINNSWRDLPPEPLLQYCRMLVRPFLHHCGVLFPRHVLENLGGYDESLLTDEDGDLLLRVLLDGHYFVPVESANYLYIHHAGGRVSSDDDIRKFVARRRVCEKVEAAFDGEKGPMPARLREALAQRMDKIAMTYWASHPAEARELLARARTLCPNYRPDTRLPLRILRRIGGPSMVLATTTLYRRLKGRPKGGAQG